MIGNLITENLVTIDLHLMIALFLNENVKRKKLLNITALVLKQKDEKKQIIRLSKEVLLVILGLPELLELLVLPVLRVRLV